MRRLAVTLVVFALGAAVAGAAVPGNSASITASTSKRGAPVGLTFTFRYPMPCGNPGTRLVVRMPAGMTLPHSIAAGTVFVDGQVARPVSLEGSIVTIPIAKKQWLSCNLLGMDSLTVQIGTAAGLANPKRTGVYGFPIVIGTIHGTPKLRITA
jgi:hypothetical protein